MADLTLISHAYWCTREYRKALCLMGLRDCSLMCVWDWRECEVIWYNIPFNNRSHLGIILIWESFSFRLWWPCDVKRFAVRLNSCEREAGGRGVGGAVGEDGLQLSSISQKISVEKTTTYKFLQSRGWQRLGKRLPFGHTRYFYNTFDFHLTLNSNVTSNSNKNLNLTWKAPVSRFSLKRGKSHTKALAYASSPLGREEEG